MREDGYDHPSARYRAMVFDGPEAMAKARESVTEAMNRTFGVKSYTTTEGWFVGGFLGNGEVNKDGPQSSPAWRQRIDKARREIEEHKDHIQWREQCEAVHRAWPSESVSWLKEFIEGLYL